MGQPQPRSQAEPQLLKIRVSLRGRPLKSYVFDQETVTVGRDPACDICLENTGVSREHLKFEASPTGNYSVTDLGSANGSLLNDKPLRKDFIYNNDVIQIGKFSLWISLESDRREKGRADAHPSPELFAHTTILSAEELEHLASVARERGRKPARLVEAPPLPEAPAAEEPVVASARSITITALVAFIAGAVVGAWAYRLLTL